jgi:hypothetical protein
MSAGLPYCTALKSGGLYLLGHDEVEVKEGHDPDVGDEELDVVGAEVDELEHGKRHQEEVTPAKVESTADIMLAFLEWKRTVRKPTKCL